MPEYKIVIDVKIKWWLRPKRWLPVAMVSYEFANRRTWMVVARWPERVPFPSVTLLNGRLCIGRFEETRPGGE